MRSRGGREGGREGGGSIDGWMHCNLNYLAPSLSLSSLVLSSVPVVVVAGAANGFPHNAMNERAGK